MWVGGIVSRANMRFGSRDEMIMQQEAAAMGQETIAEQTTTGVASPSRQGCGCHSKPADLRLSAQCKQTDGWTGRIRQGEAEAGVCLSTGCREIRELELNPRRGKAP